MGHLELLSAILLQSVARKTYIVSGVVSLRILGGYLWLGLLTWGRFDFGGAPKSHRRKIKQLTGDIIKTCVHKSFADIVDIFLGKRKRRRFWRNSGLYRYLQ